MFRPRFRYSHELVTHLLRLEAAHAAVKASAPARRVLSDLRDQTKQRYREAMQRLAGDPPPGVSAAVTLLAGHSPDVPDERALRQVHDALWGAPGAPYRQASLLMYDQDNHDLLYIAPEGADVARLMAELTAWLHQAWDVLPGAVLAGLLHGAITVIQPYGEDNGGLAMLAGELALQRRGYAWYISAAGVLADDPAAYAQAAASAHSGVYTEEPDFSAWLTYYVGGVAAAAEGLSTSLTSLLQAPDLEPAADSPQPLRARQVAALRHLLAHGALRSGEYQKLAGVVPDTARRDFDGLLDKGLIAVRGLGRGTHYVLTERGARDVALRGTA